MKALDTNVLVRFLVKDDEQQAKAVYKIYKTTSKFPNDEKFGLVSQMRRAAVSIPSNIAGSAPASCS